MGKENNPEIYDHITSYQVLAGDCPPFELREKASRFIAFAVPCDSVEQVELILQSHRKKYHDATHVCFAFRLGNGISENKRFSDDGEPSGTAGIPILQEISGHKLWNVLLMVIRYYGGTKLGTGGLVRAYGGAAHGVLEMAEFKQIEVTRLGTITFPFNETGLVMQWLTRFYGVSVSQNYSDMGITMSCTLPVKEVPRASQALIDMSAGRLKWHDDGL